MLLRAGDAEGAHAAYAAALKERPNSGFSLYGMAQASEAAGNDSQCARRVHEVSHRMEEQRRKPA